MKELSPTIKCLLYIFLPMVGYFMFLGGWIWFGHFLENVEPNEIWLTKPALIAGPVAVLLAVLCSLYFNIYGFISFTIISMASFLIIYHYDIHWETALKEQKLYAYQSGELARARQEADHFFRCASDGYIALTDGNTYFSPQLHDFKDKRYYVEYFPPVGSRKGKVFHLGLYPGGFESKVLAEFIARPMRTCTYKGKTPNNVLSDIKPLNMAK